MLFDYLRTEILLQLTLYICIWGNGIDIRYVCNWICVGKDSLSVPVVSRIRVAQVQVGKQRRQKTDDVSTESQGCS